MVDTPDNLDRIETAANIYIRFNVPLEGGGNDVFEVPVSDIDLTKEVDVARVREMGLYPDGYAVNAIDVDGSLSFAGNVVRLPSGSTHDLDDLLFKDDGSPVVFDITIVHEEPDGGETADTDTIENTIVTSSEFSSSSGDPTESSYDFMAQRVN